MKIEMWQDLPKFVNMPEPVTKLELKLQNQFLISANTKIKNWKTGRNRCEGRGRQLREWKNKNGGKTVDDACIAWRKCRVGGKLQRHFCTTFHIIVRTFLVWFHRSLAVLKSDQNIVKVSGRQVFTSQFVPYNEFAWTNCTASPGSFELWDTKILLEDLAETAHNDRAVWTRTYHPANTLIIISAPKHYFFDLFFLFSIKKWLNAFDGTGWRNCPRSPLPVSLIRRNKTKSDTFNQFYVL